MAVGAGGLQVRVDRRQRRGHDPRQLLQPLRRRRGQLAGRGPVEGGKRAIYIIHVHRSKLALFLDMFISLYHVESPRGDRTEGR